MFRLGMATTPPCAPQHLAALGPRVNLLTDAEHHQLHDTFDFLRLVESRLRIYHNRSLDELPTRPEDLEKLARRMALETAPDQTSTQKLLEELDRHTSQARQLFLEIFQREREK